MSDTQLKPCAFCGTKMHIDYDTASGMFGPEGDHTAPCILMNYDMHEWADAELLRDHWNRRTPDMASRIREALLEARAYVARIIEPGAWLARDRHPWDGIPYEQWGDAQVNASLAKADTIIALTSERAAVAIQCTCDATGYTAGPAGIHRSSCALRATDT